ncbi:hypothetical protein [Nocardia thailandica]|uniref:hypothetical protein n=1 Tax=Nocardia thailandica TaxID=257275 RepID=UPI0005BA1614|nr:hypothetical protein [Nocardia thailandica]
MTEVTISGDALELAGGAQVRFVRTLRLPETGTYPLPPGLGHFPLRRVADYADTVPRDWLDRGGVMLPVYRREALWLHFSSSAPVALQVAVGKVCAVSGQPWRDTLTRDPQNYVPLPDQPWLDGINSGTGTVRQFVAIPMGLGATVEGQVTGEEVWGGMQLAAHALTGAAREEWVAERERERAAAEARGRQQASPPYGPYGAAQGGGHADADHGPGAPPAFMGGPVPVAGAPLAGVPVPPAPVSAPAPAPALGAGPAGGPPDPGGAPAGGFPEPGGAPTRAARKSARAMGVGAGGQMKQDVYADARPVTDYSQDPDGRVFVHLVPAADWEAITGEIPPPTPISAQTYAEYHLPWFDWYAADGEDLPASPALSRVKPTGPWFADDQPDQPLTPTLPVVPLGDPKPVEDGDW